MSWLNLASWIPCTEVEGPGRRAALWVQGCDKRCIGCCNPGYLKIMERDILSAETMIERLLAAHEEWGLEWGHVSWWRTISSGAGTCCSCRGGITCGVVSHDVHRLHASGAERFVTPWHSWLVGMDRCARRWSLRSLEPRPLKELGRLHKPAISLSDRQVQRFY